MSIPGEHDIRPAVVSNSEAASTDATLAARSTNGSHTVVVGMPSPDSLAITIVPANTIPSQLWWPAVHRTIITAFKTTNSQAYPPTWTRLPQDPEEAAQKLKEELSCNGVLAVVLLGDQPVACTGARPFRGENWIDNEKSADDDYSTPANDHSAPQPAASSEDWEICCFCVHPSHRGEGLSPKLLKVLIVHIKGFGAKRLMANYDMEETGNFWPHVGFAVIPGAGGVLTKGFTLKPGAPGLLEDVHFTMATKVL